MINKNTLSLDKYLYAHITAQRFEVGKTTTEAADITISPAIHQQVVNYLNTRQQARKTYYDSNPGINLVLASESYKR